MGRRSVENKIHLVSGPLFMLKILSAWGLGVMRLDPLNEA